MENNSKRDYGQQSHNSQETDTNGTAPVTNDANRNATPERAEETAGDAYSAGFASGTNPGRYDSVNSGTGKPVAENTAETRRDVSQHANPDERKTYDAGLIPDAEDLENDEGEQIEYEEVPDEPEEQT